MRRKIKSIVDSIRRNLGTTDPFEVVYAMGGIIVYVPLVGIRGFYQNYNNVDIVYIDENLSPLDQRMVCSHELGHMLLHKNKNYFFLDLNSFESTEKYEMQANLFSAELLISDKDITENKDLRIDEISGLLGVNRELVYMKYINYNYLYQ